MARPNEGKIGLNSEEFSGEPKKAGIGGWLVHRRWLAIIKSLAQGGNGFAPPVAILSPRVDEIASSFAVFAPVPLYRGPRSAYDVELTALPADTSAPPQRPRNAPAKAKAHSYLSVVDGRPMRHATWAECERRVRGVSGARFKKSTSGADEARILRSWGYSPADVDH